MNIFTVEQEDGLEDIIKSSASITYASIAEKADSKDEPAMRCMVKSEASVKDSDLYYVQSILVSSSWNKNDDIFDKAEVWAAKDSPEDKPTNLEHDENTIIGHITANWPIDDSGNIIDKDIPLDQLPDKYHILTGSVIYRGFTDPELKNRAETLILEIENGTKFVSMECFFKGFDYGLLNTKNGKYSTLPRNESTAHLTKFLRAYGGVGQHENYKIGRVLRNITFSGKGFVNKPANPDSIIFSQSCICDKKNDSFEELGVLLNQSTCIPETIDMSLDITQNNVATEVSEASVVTENTNESPVAEVVTNTTETEAAVPMNKDEDTLMKMVEEKAMKMAEERAMKMAEEKAMKMAEEKAMKMAEEVALMKAEYESKYKAALAELEEAKEAIAAYKAKEVENMKKEKKNKRMAALIDLGVAKELANETVDKLEKVDDDTFETFKTLFTNNYKAEESVASENEEVTPELLDTVETEESVNLSVGSESVSSIDTTRAELVEFVCARLGKKLNKGE
jgi:hypothetical protein